MPLIGSNILYVFYFLIGAVAFFVCTEYIAMLIEQMNTPCPPAIPSECPKCPTPSNPLHDSSNSTSTTMYDIDVCDVVIVVLTGSNYHNTRLRDIQGTYMKHTCQTDPRKNVLFISDQANDTIPTVGVPCRNGYDDSLCCKTMHGWRQAFQLYPRAKYFVQVDDDSYVVLQNLIPFLQHFHPNHTLYTGHPLFVTLNQDGDMLSQGGDTQMTPDDFVYAAGWLGIYSRPSLERVFANKLDQVFFAVCNKYFWPDLASGIIMRSAGVLFNQDNFGFNTGWGVGYAPLKPENAMHREKTLGTHAYHDAKLLYLYEQYYYPKKD